MKTDNLTIANVPGTESSNKENELESFADLYCDGMDDLCRWLDDENVKWKEKVDRILEECKKIDGLKLISNESVLIPIKDIFDVKSICDICDYDDCETDAIMNSFCVQRLRFDTIYSPRLEKFSAFIYILEDGRFFIHHNYKNKDLLDNLIGYEFLSDYITNDYSDMLHFLLFSKESIDGISSGIDEVEKFINYGFKDDIIDYYNDNSICFDDIELKFKEIPSINSLIRVADAIYKMKARYESENIQK